MISLSEDVPLNPAAGQVLHFSVAKEFKLNDVLVIAKGTPVSGQIVDSGGERKFLKKTKATYRVSTVDTVDGAKLAIRATPGKHNDKVDGSIEPPGFRDKDKLAPAGAQFLVYFDGDQNVTVHKQ
jgi:hypothetical protein